MAIIAAELKAYQAAVMPEDDTTGSVGGAIATAGKVQFTDISATDTVTVVSDGTDVRTVTVTGRLASGVIDSDAIVLSNATPVNGVKQFERILKIVLSGSDGSRTVTVTKTSGGANIATLEPTITSTRRLFYNSASETGTVDRYEKFFLKNTNGSLTLNSATVTLTADPSAKILVAVETVKDGNNTAANRKTAPGTNIGTFTDDNVAISITSLTAGQAVGVWAKMSLSANNAAIKSTYTVKLEGTTT